MGDNCLIFYAVLVTVILWFYVFFDINYFIRVICTVVGRRWFIDNKLEIDKPSVIYGICTTQDIDITWNHMNNARYIRELDFARYNFYFRSRFINYLLKAKGDILLTASNIRYRKTIPLFSIYKITTKLIGWDEQSIYMEQQFITLRDNFVRTTCLSKQRVIGCNAMEVMANLTGKDVSYRPTLPPDLEQWLQSMEKSSLKLRKVNQN